MQKFKQSWLCLSAQTYRIQNEDGEVVEGITLRYIPTDDLTPQEDATADERGEISRGAKAAKMSLPKSAVTQLYKFPAIYEVECEMSVVRDKLQVRPLSINFLSEVKLVKVEEKKSA